MNGTAAEVDTDDFEYEEMPFVEEELPDGVDDEDEDNEQEDDVIEEQLDEMLASVEPGQEPEPEEW